MMQLEVKKKQSFQEIVVQSKYSSNNVNKRLKELRKKRFVLTFKEGRVVYYSLSELGKGVLDIIQKKNEKKSESSWFDRFYFMSH